MTELFRFTIEELFGEREASHECYVKANNLTEATDAAVDYAKDFFCSDAIEEKEKDGSIYWRTPGGEIQWKVGLIMPIECIAITPINAPVIYLPLSAPAVAN